MGCIIALTFLDSVLSCQIAMIITHVVLSCSLGWNEVQVAPRVTTGALARDQQALRCVLWLLTMLHTMFRSLRMPAEWSPHTCCWMQWPYRSDNWRHSAAPAQSALLGIACAIAAFEPVKLGVPAAHMEAATNLLRQHCSEAGSTGAGVSLIEQEANDCWMRDIGPTFVFAEERDNEGQCLAGIDWAFNAWGNKISCDQDCLVAAAVLKHSGVPRIDGGFVLEGGSIHVDGEGTVLTTEECLLNANRNPSLSKQQIEERLLSFLGAEKVIWLPRGLAADLDTDGHIDNMACFARPGEVLLAWTDEEHDEQYARCREALSVLESTTDAKQRKIKVIKVPIPPPMHYTAEDLEGVVSVGGMGRQVGERLAASYVNFYMANGGIVCPSFGCAADEQVKAVLAETFPDRKILQVPGREILLGGGNIHCITQQQPAL